MTKSYPAFVMKNKDTDKIIGFCFLHPYHPFPVFQQTAEITYFIEKNEVGKEIDKKALEKLEEEARLIDITQLLVDISSENKQSINLHKKMDLKNADDFIRQVRKKEKTLMLYGWKNLYLKSVDKQNPLRRVMREV